MTTKPELYKQAKDLGITDFGMPYNKLTKDILLTIIEHATSVIVVEPTIEATPMIVEETIQGESIPESSSVIVIEPTNEVTLVIVDEELPELTTEEIKALRKKNKEEAAQRHKEAKAKAVQKLKDQIANRQLKKELKEAKEAEIAAHKETVKDLKELDEKLEEEELQIANRTSLELPEDVVEACPKGGKFRIQNQRFFLTYKTHIPKESIVEFFQEKNAKETNVAHEVASSETDYEHSHVFVDFGKSYQSRNARVFDFNGIHPNIKLIKTAKHLERIWAYLCKEDHDNDHLLARITTQTLVDVVWSKETVNDVLRMAKKPNDVSGLVALWGFKKHEKKRSLELKHQWQFDLEAKLLEPITNDNDYRKIIWYLDVVGNTGKTLFSSYMKQKHGAAGWSSFGGNKNAGHLVKGSLDAGWNGKIAIIDLSREVDKYDQHIYGPLENIRNGEITNTKYMTCDLSWDSGHIVCFANWLPDFSEMSLDRWDLRELTKNGHDVIATSIPTHKALEMSRLYHIRASIARTVTQGLKNRDISDIDALEDVIQRLNEHHALLKAQERVKKSQPVPPQTQPIKTFEEVFEL